MIERSGFEADVAGFDEGMATGDPAAATAAISDEFMTLLTAVGSHDDVRAGVQRYIDAGADSPAVGPIPRSDFDATLRAAAPAA